jgi:VanZ family protein
MGALAPEAAEASSLIRGEDAVLPWFLPGVAISVVVSLAAGGRVGRALGVGRAVGAMLILSLGVIVSATLTPLRGGLDFDTVVSGTCDLSRIGFAPLSELLGFSDTSLNVLLFFPLGVSIAFLPRSRRTVAVILAAIALPFAIEATQLLVPLLARGCESADVVDNLTGLAVGAVAGIVARSLVTALRRDRSLAGTSR